MIDSRITGVLLRANIHNPIELKEIAKTNPERLLKIKGLGIGTLLHLNTEYNLGLDFYAIKYRAVQNPIKQYKDRDIIANGKYIIKSTPYGNKRIDKKWWDMFGYPKNDALIALSNKKTYNNITFEQARKDMDKYNQREIITINDVQYRPVKNKK